MWKGKKIALPILCLCLLLAWYGASICQSHAGWYRDCISVRWETGSGVSPQQFTKALQRQKEDGGSAPPVTLWNMQQEQLITGDVQSRVAMVNSIEYCGDIARLYQGQFQRGYWPGDAAGCVVDTVVAHTLWGSADVIGRSLNWNGTTWYVRGVLLGNDGIAFFPTSETEEAEFSGMLMDLSEANAGGLTAEQLLNQYQLPGGTITDMGLYLWLAEVMAALPAFFLWASFLVEIIKCLWVLRRMKLMQLLTAPLFILAAMLISAAAGLSWNLPERFLPTRWTELYFLEGAGA